MSSPPEPPQKFEVIHPKEPEDEPLLESYQSSPFGFWKKRYTRTGYLWLFLPWLLMWKKRMHSSLLEFLFFGILLGSGMGSSISGLWKQKAHPALLVVAGVLILHAYLLAFSAALYRQKLDPRNAARVPNGAYMLLYLLLPALASHLFGYACHMVVK